MRQKSSTPETPSERLVRDIRRATRKQYSAEEKIRIVLEGLRGEESIAALCRREGIASSMYYGWSKEFLDAGKRYEAQIYRDGDDADDTDHRFSFMRETRTVTRGDTLTLRLAKAGGAVVGLGIALMHYLGMSAYQVQGHLEWDTTYVAFSLVLAAVFGAAIAIRHLWIQALPPDQVPLCGPGLDYRCARVELALAEGRLLEPAGNNLAEYLSQLATLDASNEAIVRLRGKAVEVRDEDATAEPSRD